MTTPTPRWTAETRAALEELKPPTVEQYAADLIEAHDRGYAVAIELLRALGHDVAVAALESFMATLLAKRGHR